MNAKAKGNRQEHRAMRILEAAGYCCTRAAASLGVFDIIAVSGQGMRLIQVKSNRPPCPAEREAIELFPVPENASKEIWVFKDRLRAPLITVLATNSRTPCPACEAVCPAKVAKEAMQG